MSDLNEVYAEATEAGSIGLAGMTCGLVSDSILVHLAIALE